MISSVGDGEGDRDVQRLEDQLRYQADHDSLTGLFNRRRFDEEVAGQLLQAKRHRRTGALLLIDIDAFRFVNNSLGHEAGDRLLREVSAVLGEEARDSDVLARLGGDEFALLLREAEEEGALGAANRVIAAIKAHSERTIGASIGIATFDGSGELTAGDLLIAADIALCEAKEAGRGKAIVYTGERGHNLTWVERIREAIENQRLVVYAQPIVDLQLRTVARDELLVRMLDANGGVTQPAAFLPVAERFGLVAEVDRLVLSKAIDLAGRSRPISVNISGRSLSDERLIEDVRKAISDGLNPSWLGFEITETAAVANLGDAERFAKAITELGCSLGLDDFGTGFSSFTYLKHLPVQYLKIDIEFIRELRWNRVDQRLVQAMVDIAGAFGYETVAEGVEDADTLALVQGLGVDYAQGFYIGRPFVIER